MMSPVRLCSVLFVLILLSMSASATIYIGGSGAISTDDVFGPLGLLSGGETATATLDFSVTGSTLTLTVTNTSPSVPGTEVPTGDAPVIKDIFFNSPSVIDAMTLLTAGGVSAASSGWDFTFDPDSLPSSGHGFLKGLFDDALEGGPGPGSPDPVIASIYDPNIFDGPGDPTASPVDFVFALSFQGDIIPAGFSGDCGEGAAEGREDAGAAGDCSVFSVVVSGAIVTLGASRAGAGAAEGLPCSWEKAAFSGSRAAIPTATTTAARQSQNRKPTPR